MAAIATYAMIAASAAWIAPIVNILPIKPSTIMANDITIKNESYAPLAPEPGVKEQKYIRVPVEWLETLAGYCDQLDQGKDMSQFIIGYASSVRTLLKYLRRS